MTDANALYHNDAPAIEDKLNRDQYAKSFAEMCSECDTPLTVGIYATWGVGKTTLMQLIDRALDHDEYHVIWFNLWEHQGVENPALALSHAIARSIGGKAIKKFKKLLTLISIAFGGQTLKMATGLKIFEFVKLGNIYEEEHYQSIDASMKLKAHLDDLITQVLTASGKKKLVFFIDDLDRCPADQGLKLLDALKLYFNSDNCIYFLGVDKKALQQSLQARYNDLSMEVIRYLDKIIQMPFTVPLIEPKYLKDFIKGLLSVDLEDCQSILEIGLDRNPRQVKRFINILRFSHHVVKENVSNYNPRVLCAVLLIQYRKPDLYQLLSQKPELMDELKQAGDEGDELRTNYLEDDLDLENVLQQVDFPEPDILQSYFYHTDMAGIDTGTASREVLTKQASLDNGMDVIGEGQFLTEDDFHQVLASSPKADDGEDIMDTLLIYRTKKQHTWLVATNDYLYCLLDDANTRAGNRVVQWKQKRGLIGSVRAYESAKGNAVVDIGTRKRWLYSKRLFPEPRMLEEQIQRMISHAGNTV